MKQDFLYGSWKNWLLFATWSGIHWYYDHYIFCYVLFAQFAYPEHAIKAKLMLFFFLFEMLFLLLEC